MKGRRLTQEQRRAVLHRDGWKCRRCGRASDLNVHHRLLRSQGGGNEPENLVTVCGSGTMGCHGWIHHNSRNARALGWIVPSWASPASWPIRLGEGHWSQPKDHWWQRLTAGTEWQQEQLLAIESGH